MSANQGKTTKRAVRLFGAWSWHKEEEWLNRMAQAGWLLIDVTFLVYRFQRVEPKNWLYQLDYETLVGNDISDYRQIFSDAGWEYVTDFASWHYFRADGDEIAVKKIHTDNASRVRMLRNVMRLLMIAGLPSFIWMMTIGRTIQSQIEPNAFTLMDGVMIFVVVLILIIAYAVLRLGLEIQRLRREGSE